MVGRLMRVLVACESSGTVREAFRRLGHDAWSCDLLPADDGSQHHIQGDCRPVITDEGPWDLVIAHPPCTYLAASGLHWNHRVQGRKQRTEEAIELFLDIVNACRNGAARWCIENSIGCMSKVWAKPDQIIQPWMFGDDASKATCLWLCGLPMLTPTQEVQPRMVNGKPRWGNQTDSGQNRLPPSKDRWKIRSKTFQGIADAMAAQWSNI